MRGRGRENQFPDNGFEAWGGYMNAKISKLEEQFCNRANKEENQISDIFNGVSIYVNGYTIPSADDLKTLMSRHGGTYHTYQRSDDFIIASNLPDTKVKRMSLEKVVKPEWITDSIQSKKLLDYRDYLLYKTTRNQATLKFNKIITDETNSGAIRKDSFVNTTSTETHSLNEPISSKEKNIPLAKLELEASAENVNKICDKQTVKTAADPNFISEFYSNSRLHHISQLGAYFKQHINDLREKSDFQFPERSLLKQKISAINKTQYIDASPIIFEKGKTIMHVDMDCFFVSVGLRTRPHLKGFPVAVTHSKGGHARSRRTGVDRNAEFNLYKQKQATKISKAMGVQADAISIETRVDNIADEDDNYGSMSEIASCSYEARAKGVSNGMFMGSALKLCENLKTIPYDFEGYKEVAYTLYNTVAQYTLDIEAVSCDEMYVDCTEILKELDISVQDFATMIREEIKTKTGCPCSTGFGSNRLQARLATKKAKPDGQFFLSAELLDDFMFDIQLRELPGVGRQTALKLESLGHKTCGSLLSLSLTTLKTHLGNKTGAQLYEQCRGQDSNPLNFYTLRKSVSAEVNYGIRFESYQQCDDFLKQLSAEVHSRMVQFKVKGKCVTLKLMVRAKDAPVETAKFMGHGYCDVINKSIILNLSTNDPAIISKEVISLCRKLKIEPKEMRGIGIQITKLESTVNTASKGTINKFFSNKITKNENSDICSNNLDDHKSSSPLKIESKPKFAITPKKSDIVLSPKKKSPILVAKSPTGKRRGRPPKNLSLLSHNSKNRINKVSQIHNLIKDTPFKNPLIVKKNQETESRPILEKEEKPNNLLNFPWERVREMLRAWLESGQTPLQCDVDLISSYMQEMVVNRKIDKLYILLNFLRRRTLVLSNAAWNDVYNRITDNVQNTMLVIYGKKLLVTNY